MASEFTSIFVLEEIPCASEGKPSVHSLAACLCLLVKGDPTGLPGRGLVTIPVRDGDVA